MSDIDLQIKASETCGAFTWDMPGDIQRNLNDFYAQHHTKEAKEAIEQFKKNITYTTLSFLSAMCAALVVGSQEASKKMMSNIGGHILMANSENREIIELEIRKFKETERNSKKQKKRKK